MDINDIWKERIDVGMVIDEIWKKVERRYYDSGGGDLWERGEVKETELDELRDSEENGRKMKSQNMKDEGQYKRLKHEIQKSCREPRTNIMRISAKK